MIRRGCSNRPIRRNLFLALILLFLTGQAVRAQAVNLYDPALAGTPDSQGMSYHATGTLFYQPPVAAEQRFINGLTELETDAFNGDHAGYTAGAPQVPVLDRSRGFTLTFQLQVLNEQHTSNHRAGLSVIILANDRRGIELGFWEDRVWAQHDDPLFTKAEEAQIDTGQLNTYELSISGDTYTLRSGNVILRGAVRNYQASIVPVYRSANIVFLGDNTTSAGAMIRLGAVRIEAAPPASATPAPTVPPTIAPD
ncbi:MAG: hypothetical protein HC822_16570, partial [Oscillochloris sp.]|nr:hypothetical protein [Oscillochloris sp.]